MYAAVTLTLALLLAVLDPHPGHVPVVPNPSAAVNQFVVVDQQTESHVAGRQCVVVVPHFGVAVPQFDVAVLPFVVAELLEDQLDVQLAALLVLGGIAAKSIRTVELLAYSEGGQSGLDADYLL